MDPKARLLKKVSVEDAALADQQFSFLMGDDVAPRKDFIAKNAKFVKNLDI
jgi:DNA gyrase subunit B